MKIIIEGPNGVGKTQFINQLLAIPIFEDFHVEHQTKWGPNTEAYYYDCLAPDLENIIYDRFAASEIIYSGLENRANNFTIDDYAKLVKETAENSLDAVLWVFVDADYDMIYRAYESRGDVIDYEYIKKEKEAFRHFIGLTYEYTPNVFEVKVHYNDEYNEKYSVHNVLNKLNKFMGGKTNGV